MSKWSAMFDESAPSENISRPPDKIDRNAKNTPELNFGNFVNSVTGVSNPNQTDSGWPEDIAAIIERFRAWTPEVEQFELKRGVTIANPPRWKKEMLLDIETGPGRSRDYWGAVRNDLNFWDGLFGAGADLAEADTEYERLERAALVDESGAV